MRSRRPWSIRRWLGSLVAGVALPLLLLLIWIFGTQLRREQFEARESALRMARATARRVGVQHRDSEALLAQMANRPAIRDFDGRTCDSLFAIVNFFPQWSDLLLFDGQGKVVCSADPRGEDLKVSFAVQPWLESALRARAVEAGQPTIRRVGSHWVSILSKTVASNDGTPRGVLVLLQWLNLTGGEALPPGAVPPSPVSDRILHAAHRPGGQRGNEREHHERQPPAGSRRRDRDHAGPGALHVDAHAARRLAGIYRHPDSLIADTQPDSRNPHQCP